MIVFLDDALMSVCTVYESHAGYKRERADHVSTMEEVVPLDGELVSVCTD